MPSNVRLVQEGSNHISKQVLSATDITLARPHPNTSPITSLLIPAPALASSRYNRQLLIPSVSLRGQILLSQSKILIVGLGGLGCPAALYLAGAGVHTLGLVDADTIEVSNLHRQVLHREDSVYWSKVDSAIRGCRELNSEVRYVGYKTRLSTDNALDIVRGYDMVLDCTDNPATRYLISDACVLLHKPLVSGAAQRTEGQLMVLNYPVSKGPCYRCVFPQPPAPEAVLGCSEIGILGPAVGVVGVLMASEAIRMVVMDEKEMEGIKPSLLLYNAFRKDSRNWFRTVGLRSRRQECVACGDGDGNGVEKVTVESFQGEWMDYEAFCGRLEDVRVLQDDERIDAREFLDAFGSRTVGEVAQKSCKNAVVVDVREENEVELGPKIRGSVNIPISRILRQGAREGEGKDLLVVFDDIFPEHPGGQQGPVYFVCQRGNDSQIAARKMMDTWQDRGTRMPWIGDVRGGFEAIEKEAAKPTHE